MKELSIKEKIELLEKLVGIKRGRDKFYEKFDELFGCGHGFPGASEGLFDVFNDLFSEYSSLVAEKIGDTKEGIDWFIYENDCGENGLECGLKGSEVLFYIRNASDYINYLFFLKEEDEKSRNL